MEIQKITFFCVTCWFQGYKDHKNTRITWITNLQGLSEEPFWAIDGLEQSALKRSQTFSKTMYLRTFYKYKPGSNSVTKRRRTAHLCVSVTSIGLSNVCIAGRCVFDAIWYLYYLSMFWYSCLVTGHITFYFLLFVDRKTNLYFVITISRLLIEWWLPKYGPKLRLWRHVKFGIFSPPSKAHFYIFFLDTPSTY